MYTKQFLLFFGITFFSYTFAAAQTAHIDSLEVDSMTIINEGNLQHAVTDQGVVMEDNVLHIDVSVANLAATTFYWKVQADYDGDGLFENGAETLHSSNTGSSPNLTTSINLGGEYLMALLIKNVPIRIMASDNNVFPVDTPPASDIKASIILNLLGPIKVGNSADASERCLPATENTINNFYVENTSQQTVVISAIDLTVTAPNSPTIQVSTSGTTLGPLDSLHFDVLFDEDFGTLNDPSFDLTFSFDWNYTSTNPTSASISENYGVCTSSKPKSLKNELSSSTVNSRISAVPNPFYQTTDINYTIEKTGLTNIAVYNSVGQKIKTLVNNTIQEVGPQHVELNGYDLKPGLYFVQIKVGDDVKIKQVIKQ